MRRIILFIILFALTALSGLALAQGAGAVPADLSAWYESPVALGAVIVAIVAAVRRYIWRSLDGGAVALFTLALGAVLGIVGFFLGYLPAFIGALVFGIVAGAGAIGIVEGVRAATRTQNLERQ